MSEKISLDSSDFYYLCCAASEPEFALKRMQIGNGRKSRPFIWKRK